MKLHSFLTASSLALTLAVTGGVGTTFFIADSAEAASDNRGGNGNGGGGQGNGGERGNGNGNGKSGERGNSGGNGNGNGGGFGGKLSGLFEGKGFSAGGDKGVNIGNGNGLKIGGDKGIKIGGGAGLSIGGLQLLAGEGAAQPGETETEVAKNNGRGALASELKGLNAAHASPTALANASPNSMPGKLRAYQEAYWAADDAQAALDEAQEARDALVGLADALSDAEDAQATAQSELDGLTSLTEDQIAENYDSREAYEAAVVEAEAGVTSADDAVAQATGVLSAAEDEWGTTLAELDDIDAQRAAIEEDRQGALATLTGGRSLSDAAMEELHRLLGMDERPETEELTEETTNPTTNPTEEEPA